MWLQVRSLLEDHDDTLLTQMLREVGLVWDAAAEDARADAIARLAAHLFNLVL